jgi:exonuclease III
MFVPGPLSIVAMFSQPDVIKILLFLSNDIESNPGPIVHHFNILFSNINSLTAGNCNRFEDLKLRLDSEKVHFAGISETGTNMNIDLFNIDHYHKLDINFHKLQGRGIIVYIHESIAATRRLDLEDVNFETIWFETKLGHKKLFIALYYRSPSQSPNLRDQFMQSFENSVRLASDEGGSIIIGGDFNCRSNMWWVDDLNSTEGDRLYQVSVNSSLTQLIHEPNLANLASTFYFVTVQALYHLQR